MLSCGPYQIPHIRTALRVPTSCYIRHSLPDSFNKTLCVRSVARLRVFRATHLEAIAKWVVEGAYMPFPGNTTGPHTSHRGREARRTPRRTVDVWRHRGSGVRRQGLGGGDRRVPLDPPVSNRFIRIPEDHTAACPSPARCCRTLVLDQGRAPERQRHYCHGS